MPKKDRAPMPPSVPGPDLTTLTADHITASLDNTTDSFIGMRDCPAIVGEEVTSWILVSKSKNADNAME